MFYKTTTPMIHFKPVVLEHHKRRDGTFPVKIRITFNRSVRYLPTTLTCTASDLTRSMKIKNADIIARADEVTNRLRREAATFSTFDIQGKDVDYVIKKLTERLKMEDFRLDFFAWADEFLMTKSHGNRLKYETALNAFARFLGRRSIDINEITHAMLVQFADAADSGCKLAYSRRKGIIQTDKPRTGKISPHYLAHLSHIYDGAKDRYNDEDGGAVVIPRSPFRKLDMTPPKPTTGQKPLDVEVIQAMIDTPLGHPCRAALDVFLVSLLLMGANAADLWDAPPQKGQKWVYFRTKTRNRRADHSRIECAIMPQLRPILGRLGAGTSASVWLPIFHAMGSTASIAGQTVNRRLRQWADGCDKKPFTLYAARHSFATLARRCGVEKATVEDALGHVGEFKMADIYAERDWSLAEDALRKVAALFRWPE